MYTLDTRTLLNINGSALITLPISWIRNNGLVKGQKVSVALDDKGRLVITAPEKEEYSALPDPHLGGSNQAATSNTPNGVVA